PPRDDARRRHLHPRRNEPTHAAGQAGRLCRRHQARKERACRMRSRVPRARVSHDRWLVSYADFITLLFGFFVVLYAFARADQKKQMQVSAAIDSAFRSMGALPQSAHPPSNNSAGSGVQAASANSIVAEHVLTPAQIKDELDRLRRDLAQAFSGQIASRAMSLEMGPDGLVISLREAGFF